MSLPGDPAQIISLFAQSPVGLAIFLGPDHVFEFANASYENLMRRRNLVGRAVRDVFRELDRAGEFDPLDQVYRTGRRFERREHEVHLGGEDGAPLQQHFLDLTYEPLRDDAGAVIGVMAMASDVTAQVRVRQRLEKEKEFETFRNELLERQQRWLEAILERTPALILLIDAVTGRALFANRAAREFYGEDIVTRSATGRYNHLTAAYDRDGNPLGWDQVPSARAVRGEYVRGYEVTVDSDLGRRYLIADTQRMPPIGTMGDTILVCAQDITPIHEANRRLQDERAKLRQLADTAPQIVWTARPDGVSNYVNAQWARYSGSDEAARWHDFIEPSDRPRVARMWRYCVDTGQPFEAEFRLLRAADLTYRWHLVRAVQVFNADGTVASWFGTCTDIQDQKEAQATLSAAIAAAEAASLAKTAFLANMSHEIRTPLGAIMGFTQLLKTARLTAEEKSHLDVILRNGQILTRVIDDILDISKIEAGKLDILTSPFSPAEMVEEVVALFADRAREKGVRLDVTIAPSVPAVMKSDPHRLRQILVNLIGNAVKFTAQGTITVSARAKPDDLGDVLLVIRVKDTGMGIDPADAALLFQPFKQAEGGANRKFGGTGLGLTISKKLAQAMGGDVRLVDSGLGRGCEFEIRIRGGRQDAAAAGTGAPARARPAAERPAPRERLRGVRILGVDDSPDNRTLLKIFLQRECAEYDEADGGEEALRKLRDADYDVVLMDIQMPGLDGYETVRILRDEGFAKPIIALTAHAMNEERRRTLASGFSDHVTKPIDANELVGAILKQLPH